MSQSAPVVLRLIRIPGLSVDSVPGLLLFPAGDTLVTLELLYEDNRPNISSIPYGKYVCRRRSASPGITADLKETFEVTGVPARSDILFHVANYPEELKGCIALGKDFLHGQAGSPAIFNSRRAFLSFMGFLNGVDQFLLEIERASCLRTAT